MPMMVKLEDRIVLDGAALFAVVEEYAADAVERLESISEFASEQFTAMVVADDSSQRKTLDIVLVSNGLDDHQQLVAAATPGTMVLVYDAENTSPNALLQQLQQLAVSQGAIQSLTIMSHGDAAQFRLGNAVVDANQLAADAAAWQSLAGHFSGNATINLFACDLASTHEGEQLVKTLAELTDANVNASSNITGVGGDWELEYQVQQHAQAVANAVSVLEQPYLDSYSHSLDAMVVNNTTLNADEALGTVITNAHLLTTATTDSGDDVPPENVEYTITSTPNNGTIRVDGRAVSVNETFTQADIDAGLVTYEHNGEEPSAVDGSDQDSFEFLVSDPALNQTSGEFNIVIAQTNDAPILDMDPNAGGRGSELAINGGEHGPFTEGGNPVLIAQDDGINIIDVDDTHLEGATSQIINLSNVGDEILAVDTTGTNITAVYDAQTGTLTLSGTDTIENYEQVLSTLTYENTSDDPNTDQRRILTSVNDGDASSNVSRSLVDIVAVNDAPTLDLNGAANNNPVEATFTEDGPSVLVTPDANLEITDPDNTTLASATVTITNPLDAPSELLSVDTTGTNITAQYDPVTGTLQLTGVDSIENYEAVLQTLSYENTDDGADPTDRLIGITVNDGVDDSPQADAIVHIILVNDAPEVTVLGAQTIAEDTSQVIPGVSIGDPDAGTAQVEVTLTVGNGTLSLPSTNGLTFVAGSGSNDDTVTIQGTVDDINAALATLEYQGDAEFVGNDQLDIVVNDLGNTSTFPGPQLTDTASVALTVTEVEDAPVVDLDGAGADDTFTVTFTEEAGSINLLDIPATVSDIDSANLSEISVQIDNIQDAGEEVLSVDTGDTGLNANYDPATGILTISGNATVADYQDVLNTLQYNNTADEPNPLARTVSVVATDSAGTESDPVSGTVNIQLVNDAPEWTVPGTQQADEDTSLPIAGISIADDDVGNGDVEVTLSVDNGTITLGDTTGLSFTVGDATDDATMTFTGSLDDVNAALATLSYQGDPQYNGNDTLQLYVDDLGNTPAPSLTDTATVDIVIAPVNDAPSVDLDGAGGADTFTATFTEEGGAVDVLADPAELSDIDSANLSELTVQIDNIQDAADELLLVDTAGTNLIANFDPDTGLLTISGEGTAAEYQAVLNTLQYNNTADEPNTTPRILTVVATDDAGAESAPTSGTVNVILVNDAPEWAAPPQTAEEDTLSPLTDISISDDDAGNGDVEVTVSVDNGTLTLLDTTGVTFTNGDGTADTTMTFTGTVDEVNAALATLNYQGDAEFSGTDTLHLYVDDQGNTPGAPLTADVDVAINVTPVNDAPTLDLDGAGATDSFETTFTEDGGPVSLNIIDADIADIDSAQMGSAVVRIDNLINVGDEQLLVDTTGTNIVANYDAATGTLTLTGDDSIAAYEQVLSTLNYDNASNDPTEVDRTVSVQLIDADGASSNVGTGVVHVIEVNDAPTTPATDLLSVPAEGSVSLAGALVAVDPDNAPDELTFTVQSLPTNGILTLNGVPVVVGDTFTQEAVNNGELVYVNQQGNEFNDSFDYIVTDIDGASSATATFTFEIIQGFINEVETNSFDGGGVNNNLDLVTTGQDLQDLGWQPGGLPASTGLGVSTVELEAFNLEYSGLLDVAYGGGWSSAYGGFVQMGGFGQDSFGGQGLVQACSLLDTLQIGCRFADTTDLNARMDIASPNTIDRYMDSSDLELMPMGAAALLGISGELVMDTPACETFNQEPGILAQAYNGNIQGCVDTSFVPTEAQQAAELEAPVPVDKTLSQAEVLAFFDDAPTGLPAAEEATGEFIESAYTNEFGLATTTPVTYDVLDRDAALQLTDQGAEFQPATTDMSTVTGDVSSALSIDDLIDLANVGLEVE